VQVLTPGNQLVRNWFRRCVGAQTLLRREVIGVYERLPTGFVVLVHYKHPKIICLSMLPARSLYMQMPAARSRHRCDITSVR
jgi:hypothetical protein